MLHQLYLRLPPILQNAALSSYGYRLFRQRFAQGTPTPANPFTPPAQAQFQHQVQLLRSMLEHCKKVPAYKKILQNINISQFFPEQLADTFPVLTKKDIQKNPQQFINTSTRRPLILSTSGSSGTPLQFTASTAARCLNYAYYDAALRHFGCHYRSKSTTFAGRILYKNPNTLPARYDHFNRTQYLSSYFISGETVTHYIQALNSWAPEFIDAYPSALMELVSLAKIHRLQLQFRPKFILTSSETLFPHARAALEDYFNCPVVDHYGCAEMAVSAFSYGGPYIISPEYCVAEAIPKGDGLYSLVVTGLLNEAMPLVRYEIGDIVQLVDNNPYILASIEGRMDDIVVTPEGKKIGRLGPAFKDIQGIGNSQIIQTAINQLDVKIVLSESNAHLFNAELLRKNLQERTSPVMQVNIQYVNSIEKGRNGKIRFVISKI